MVVHLLLLCLRISLVSTELRISRRADSCKEERFIEGSFEYYQQGAGYSFWRSRLFKEGKPAFRVSFCGAFLACKCVVFGRLKGNSIDSKCQGRGEGLSQRVLAFWRWIIV